MECSFLFYFANHLLLSSECQQVYGILRLYEKVLGQKINQKKISLFFTPRPHAIQDEIQTLSDVPIVRSHEKCSSLQSTIERS